MDNLTRTANGTGDGDKTADAKKLAKELRKAKKKARKQEKIRLKLLKAETKKKDLLRDHLNREIKFTNLTHSRADKDWEQLCIDIKVPELRDDFQRTIQGVDRMLDKKSHVIQRLNAERKTADEQYRRNVQKHTELIEFFMSSFIFFILIYFVFLIFFSLNDVWSKIKKLYSLICLNVFKYRFK